MNRAVLAHRALTGISRTHLANLPLELSAPWQAALEGQWSAVVCGIGLLERGARHRLVFVDRVIVTLIHLHHDLPHSVLGLLYEVDRSTITRAVKVRGMLAPHLP